MQTLVHHWHAATRDIAAEDVSILRGETVRLEAVFWHGGEAVVLPQGTGVALYTQKPGMGENWWDWPASVTPEGAATALFTPAMDDGSLSYIFFLKVELPGGIAYRAHGRILMLGSPGPNPNQLPLPAKTIDFDGLQVLNPGKAPWLLKGDIETARGILSGLATKGEPRTLDDAADQITSLANVLQALLKEYLQ